MPIRPSVNSPIFPIGCIVAVHCHPYFKDSHKDLVHISGEPTLLPPLMIVAEVLSEKKASYEEHTGLLISDKQTYQCRCIWYSLKSNQIEEAWLSSKLLRRVSCTVENTSTIDYSHGTTVALKTSSIEIGKKKSTLKEFSKNGESSNSVTALLSFTCPPMLVIGTVKQEIKEPLIDTKTGEKRRWISERILKCKYFNPNSDKLSEAIIPIEALSKIKTIDSSCLNDLEEKIEKGELIKIDLTYKGIDKTIIRPLKINYKGGFYFLEAKDYIQNQVIEIRIEGEMNQFENEGIIIQTLPNVDASVRPMIFHSVNMDNLEGMPKGKFWRIKYKDSRDIITKRTIFSPNFVAIAPENHDNEEIGINNIEAKCLLRNNEIRYFKIDNILKLEVLDIDVPASLDDVSGVYHLDK